MSGVSSGSVRFQNDPSSSRPSGQSSSAPTTMYLVPPVHYETTSLLSPEEQSYNRLNNTPPMPSHSSLPNRRYQNNNNHSLSPAPSNGSQLRPRKSLMMRQRLRHLQYDDEPVPVSKPLPNLPPDATSGAGVGSNSGGGGSLPRRRGANSFRKDRLFSFRKSPRNLGEETMDTSGLLNHPVYNGQQRESFELNALPQNPLSDIDLADNDGAMKSTVAQGDGRRDDKAELDESDQHQHHGHHHHGPLFPYRDTKKNFHALWTFIRRFFLVLLVIPGWVIPYVLNAKLEHEQQLKGQGHLKARAPEAGGEGEIMLSKGVNLLVFLLNMFAMMHLGKAAGACLEELVPKLGMRIVSIFDAMTSSSVELAVAAFALMKGLVRVVQAAMLGAILNNLLLMMGITFVVGGYYHTQQHIEADTSQTGMNLLMIVCISYVIPVALDSTWTELRTAAIPTNLTPTQLLEATAKVREQVDADILTISKVMAMIMLVLYGCCLFFQFISQHFIVTPEAEHAKHSEHSEHFMVTPEAKHSAAHTVHERNVHYWFAAFAYCIMLGAQIYSANLLVHAVEALGKQYQLNDSFVGFVLLPIVLISDLQEEVIAIKESRANRLDRSVALMIGSCMQISLLVTPLLVLLGWIIGEPMTFRFSLMEAVILAGSVLMVNYLIQDNETNWLEGGLLLAAFFMCAMAFYYDNSSFHGSGGAHESAGGASAPVGGGGNGTEAGHH
ncbi:hypothetical protein BGX28_010513 [Mortierella sp. GBA30]|nr:hypothetical protein BGX28_010513 [Mortierella sp. GBA30]